MLRDSERLNQMWTGTGREKGEGAEEEHDEEDEEGKVQQHVYEQQERLNLSLLWRIFDHGHFGRAYLAMLGPEGQCTSESLELLKLFDGYLHTAAESDNKHSSYRPVMLARNERMRSDAYVLANSFIKHAKRTNEVLSILLQTMQTKSDADHYPTPEDEELRTELSTLHNTIVLIVEAILAFVLPARGSLATNATQELSHGLDSLDDSERGQSENEKDSAPFIKEEATLDRERPRLNPVNIGSKLEMGHQLTRYLRDPHLQTVEVTIDLLRKTSQYRPAISPFNPLTDEALVPPEGHMTSTTGAAPPTATPSSILNLPQDQISSVLATLQNGIKPSMKSDAEIGEEDMHSLPFLRRNLLRLLPAMTYLPPNTSGGVSPAEKREVKAVQDRVREYGGLVDVLNLTNLDIENPCELVALSSFDKILR